MHKLYTCTALQLFGETLSDKEISALFSVASRDTVSAFAEAAHNIAVVRSVDITAKQVKFLRSNRFAIQRLLNKELPLSVRRRAIAARPKVLRLLALMTESAHV